MKRRGGAGPSGYGIGGLVPRAPASSAGKFLSAMGTWEVPAGGSGTAAATQIVSAGTTLTIGSISDGHALVRSGTSVAGATVMRPSNNLSDVASVYTSVSNLALSRAVFGTEVVELIPGRIGTTVSDYIGVGFPSTQGHTRAPTLRVRRGPRTHARHSPAASTDGSVIGGYSTTAANGYLRASSSQAWVTYHWFATNAGTAFRLAVYLGNANAADVDKVANNGFGVRVRPATAANFFAYSTDNAGATTVSDLGVAPAANTAYVVEIAWDGTSVKVRIATVDDATMQIGAWSAQATISANLPSNTLDLSGGFNSWCHGTPGTMPVVDVGGYRIFSS